MKDDIFKKNTIKSAVEQIQKLVKANGYYIILFPAYVPDLGIGKEYSVVGKASCQTRIANLLKSVGIEGKKVAPSYYLFICNHLTADEKEKAEQEALCFARWYDLIDD